MEPNPSRNLKLISRIKNDTKFCKKNNLALIDDLESFKVFLESNNKKNFIIKNIFLGNDYKVKEFFNQNFLLNKIDQSKIHIIDSGILYKYTQVNNCKLAAIIEIKEDLYNISSTFEDKLKQDKICFIFDGIHNPWNLGGIMRTNSAFKIENVILTGNSTFPFNPRVIRASKGYIFNQNIKILNYDQLSFLLNSNCKVFFLENIKEAFLVEKLENFLKNGKIYFFVFGSEQKGISQNLKEIVKKTVKEYYSLKIKIEIDSLNLFSSHSILVYLLSKNRDL